MIDQFYRLARPVLFQIDSETVHDAAIAALGRVSTSERALELLGRFSPAPDPRLAVPIGVATFPGPVGIAAGLDKNAVAFPALAALGWDSIEIGTITPLPQPGNPKPRVFRLRDDQALINRMGFPGAGADVVAMNLLRRRTSGACIGCNIGPNKGSVESGLDAVIRDCSQLARRFTAVCDYLVMNVSSPNTRGLRELQGTDALRELLTEVRAAMEDRSYPPAAAERGRSALASAPSNRVTPLLVKIAPNLTEGEVSEIVTVVQEVGLDGIVATNSTTARPPNLRSRGRGELGGLSGPPLRDRSLRIVRQIAQETDGGLPIVAVGGISSGSDALAAIQAGAWAVQVYTGLVYEGPGLATRIERDLIRELDRTGATKLAELRENAG